MKTIRRFCRQILLGTLLMSCGVCLADGQQTGQSNLVIPTISMTGAPLSQAIDLLARESGINYIISPKVSAEAVPPLNFKWTNITARTALDRVLKEHDLALIDNPATTVARIEPVALNGKPVDPALVGNDTNTVDRAPSTNGIVPTIMMTEAPLSQAIDLLARESKLHVSYDPKSLGDRAEQYIQTTLVTFRWENLTPRQALVAILDCYDLTLVQSPASSNIIIKAKPMVKKH